jgi:hypothetical protein
VNIQNLLVGPNSSKHSHQEFEFHSIFAKFEQLSSFPRRSLTSLKPLKASKEASKFERQGWGLADWSVCCLLLIASVSIYTTTIFSNDDEDLTTTFLSPSTGNQDSPIAFINEIAFKCARGIVYLHDL